MSKEALKLALEALEMTLDTPTDVYDTKYQKAIDVAKEALAQPEQEYKRGYADAMNWKVQNHLEHLPVAQPELTLDGLTPTEFALRELYEFQEATGCDTAAEFKAQPEQEPLAWAEFDGEGGYHFRAYEDNEDYAEQWDKRNPNHVGWVKPLYESPPKPEQEPVAMKFKIYKPTVPDPTRQGINNAPLPWVYDQDRSSGFDASMWVTPVATLPPQRTWVGLTPQERDEINEQVYGAVPHHVAFHHAIEAKLKEKNTWQDGDCKHCVNGCPACDARRQSNVLS